ncbi:MAG: hypothetical protein IPH11_19265 [Ignavibacteriales bacterium]|nr:hypothetical protein [Ignavibacteriales bacterium]
MKNSFSILEILNAICDDNITRLQINQLVVVCQKIAHTYLKYRYKNISKALLAEDVSLTEMSIESIVHLFERDSNGVFIRLKTLIHNWQPQIETEESALYFLNSLVSKSSENYVAQLLRTSDPFFSKILDSVSYKIDKEKYCKKHFLGITYIVQDDREHQPDSLPDADFINSLPAELFSSKKMLEKIFSYIKAQTNKTPAIPINALVMRIKKLNAAELLNDGTVEVEDKFEVNRIVDKALKSTFEKMRVSYLAQHKLNEFEVSGIEKALQSISTDLKDGGVSPGLYKYLFEQFIEISLSDYQKKYQNIFEYLFKIFKKEITDLIKN